MNWILHRMYFEAFRRDGWPVKKAYEEAIRLASEALK